MQPCLTNSALWVCAILPIGLSSASHRLLSHFCEDCDLCEPSHLHSHTLPPCPPCVQRHSWEQANLGEEASQSMVRKQNFVLPSPKTWYRNLTWLIPLSHQLVKPDNFNILKKYYNWAIHDGILLSFALCFLEELYAYICPGIPNTGTKESSLGSS